MAARLFLLAEGGSSPTPSASTQPTEGPGPTVELSQARCLTLQQELRSAYGAPAFQKRLAQLQRQEEKLPHNRLSVKDLVRRAQARVLPSYNFEATDEGVAALAAALGRYQDSPDAPFLVALLGGSSNAEVTIQEQDPQQLQKAEAKALALPTAAKVAMPAVQPQAKAKAARGTRSLTKADAEELLSQLKAIQGSRRFERLGLVLSNTKTPDWRARILPRHFSELELTVYAEVLARFGFDDGVLGMSQMWQALQPLLGEPTVLEKAQVLVEEPALPCATRPCQDPDAGRGGGLPRLTEKGAISMQLELLERCTAPQFQVELNKLHRDHHPCSASFGERLANLLAPVYAQVLPKYGFAYSEEGLEVMTLAMGKMLRNLDVQVLAAAIDGLLYGAGAPPQEAETFSEEAEAAEEGASPGDDDWQATIGDCLGFVEAPRRVPWNQATTRLGRRQALQLLREHLAAFSAPAFQRKVSVLRADKGDRLAVARAELALAATLEILPKFGFEASLQGAHAMLHVCAEHIFDPEVARLTASIHFLLGMEEPACKAIVARLRRIQEDASLPSGY